MNFRQDRNKVFNFLVILIAVVVFLWLAFTLLFDDREVAKAATGFDHSNCQYPWRESNPPNGCDNSDPAVPECMSPKIPDEQACIDAFVKAHNEKDGQSTDLTPEIAPAAPEAVKPPSCTE